MGNSLFDLVGEVKVLYDLAIDPECDPRAFDDTLDGIMGEIEVKAGGYAHVLKQLEMEQKQAEEISKAFAEKAKVRANNIKRMKDTLAYAMESLNVKELEAGDFTFKLQNNGGKEPIVIDKPDAVPDSLTKIIVEPDKEKIREYLMDHEADFAHIEPRGKHIVIK